MGVRDQRHSSLDGTLDSNPSATSSPPKLVVLDIIGANYLRDVEPGELVWITQSGLASFARAPRSVRPDA